MAGNSITSSSKSLPKISPEVQVILDWKANPVLFVESVWGQYKREGDEYLTDEWQRKALMALVEQDKPISIRSGHGVGKSAFLSWVIIWWLLFKDEPRVPCTAPTGHQLNDVLWGEIAKWHKRLPHQLRKELEIKMERVTALRNPREYYAVARTARKEQPEALQGYHSGDLLFVCDEASGIEDIIFELGEGSMSTRGAVTIMTGNPTRTSGYFFDSHNRLRSLWWTLKVSSSDAKMVDPAYAERMATRYGRDSNIYRVRVLGEFPLVDDDSVIPLEFAESAVGRDVEPITDRIVWGVDVARFGDDSSALAKRQGNVQIGKVVEWRGKDLMQTTGIIVNEYNEAKKKPALILVDSIGLGAGVVDRLKENGLPVRGVNVAESSSSSEKYMRLRDELWWKSREWLQERNCRLEDDDDLIGELTSPKYSFTSAGKIVVESKIDMKKRGVSSPNKADAWNLTFHDSGRGGSRWKELSYPNLGYI